MKTGVLRAVAAAFLLALAGCADLLLAPIVLVLLPIAVAEWLVDDDVERYVAATSKLSTQDTGPRGFPSSSAVWPTNEIRVGWENPTAENEKQRGWMKESVLATWAANSGVKLVGWEQADASTNIRILLDDAHPHTKGLGRQLDKKKNGMVLNVTFQKFQLQWPDNKPFSPDPAMTWQEFVIRAIAVHEFGHALGISHEQNRDDAPNFARNCVQGEDGDFKVGPYDAESVMNYANKKWNNFGRLSAQDKTTIAFLYPKDGTTILPAAGAWSGEMTQKKQDGSNVELRVELQLSQSKNAVTGAAHVSYVLSKGDETVRREIVYPVQGSKVNTCFILYSTGDVDRYRAETKSGLTRVVEYDKGSGKAAVDGIQATNAEDFVRICREETKLDSYVSKKVFCVTAADGRSCTAEVNVGGARFNLPLRMK